MKVVIVGGVAAGASTAARLRRLDETAEIIIFERGNQVSYANCGLPYYVGGVIEQEDELLLQTPESLWERFHIQVRVCCEVLHIYPAEKEVEVRDLKSGHTFRESYDKLVLTPGGEAVMPPIPGKELPCVRTVRTVEDALWLRRQVEGHKKRAAVVGGGFIGLEMAENLQEAGLEVLLLEGADQIFPPFDREMAAILQKELEAQGIHVRLQSPIRRVEEENGLYQVVFGEDEKWQCDLVVMAIGVRPESRLAREAGLEVNNRGGIVVDSTMKTSDPCIYAAGDAVEVVHQISGQHLSLPLAGPANRQGRLIAAQLTGQGNETFSGVVGTSAVKVFEQTAACTGLNEKTLQALHMEYRKVYLSPLHHAGYYPGGEPITMKLLFAPDGKILGLQCVGKAGVEKRVDVTAALLQHQGTVSQMAQLELCYAPPYSSAKDPLNYAGFIAENVLAGRSPVQYWENLADGIPQHVLLLDVRTPAEYANGHVDGSQNIPVDELRDRLDEIPKNKEIWVICQVGLRGYLAQRILMQHRPDQKILNMSGGYRLKQVTGLW